MDVRTDLFGLLPVGTHDWRRFLTADEVAAALGARGCVVEASVALGYAPGPRGGVAWRSRADARSAANFLLHARKRGEPPS